MKKHRLTLLTAGVLLISLTACAANGNATNQASPNQPQVANVVNASIAYSEDVRMLVGETTLAIVGAPEGVTEEIVLDQQGQGLLADFPQTIRVLEVLMGKAPGNTIRIARTGISSKGRGQGTVAEDLLGPLPPGRHVLLLMPSADPQFYQIVGYASGEMRLNAAGRVTGTRPEAREFENLDITEVRQKLTTLRGTN